MTVFTIIFTAIGLAMDAFAVSVTSGLTIKKIKTRDALTIAAFFGGFQGIMPVLGWAGGALLRKYIGGFGYWLAFVLLAFIGAKMIYESTDTESEAQNPLDLRVLLILAVATSIDAFGVGLSFSLLKMPITYPALIIAAITFILSFAGVHIGNRFGHLFEKKAELAGGIILILIGLKIIADHLLQ